MKTSQRSREKTAILPPDYPERLYAGVVGKTIGVYLGRPFEGWANERIEKELGEIHYYVSRRLKKGLVVADDDLQGTFTFPRALEDHGFPESLNARQIGETWLDYTIEKQTLFWWGGTGNSTEHTAYLRLKEGIPAPRSGSIDLNGHVVAEQIGAQIFIDGWGWICPGNMSTAARFAGEAARVSHDGAAAHAAQVIAAMNAGAFVETNIFSLLDKALTLIPKNSLITRVSRDVLKWSKQHGPDWRATLRQIEKFYWKDKFPGACHVVPNYAIVVMGLLHGGDDFQKALMIGNTAGFDTDCNSGNIGAINGVRLGLKAMDVPDWRTPFNDRVLISTADAGGLITDCVQITDRFHRITCKRLGIPYQAPKQGAIFHFSFPGSTQGFEVDPYNDAPPGITIGNVRNREGTRSLSVSYSGISRGCPARIVTRTWMAMDEFDHQGYNLLGSPRVYSGQTLKAEARNVDGKDIKVNLIAIHLSASNRPLFARSRQEVLKPGATLELNWRLPLEIGNSPIQYVGFEIHSDQPASGRVELNFMTWDGTPRFEWTRPIHADSIYWQRQFVCAASGFQPFHNKTPGRENTHVVQSNELHSRLVIHGAADWKNYRFTAKVTTNFAERTGLAVCVQGLTRYYSLTFGIDHRLRLEKQSFGNLKVLAEKKVPFVPNQCNELSLAVAGHQLTAWLNGKKVFRVADGRDPFLSGAVALLTQQGRTTYTDVIMGENASTKTGAASVE